MNQRLYENYETGDMTLKDHLAIERTALANERTLLAYVRTMIGLVAVGGTLIKFFTDRIFVISGWFLFAIGFILLIVGFSRYLRIYVYIQSMEKSDQVDPIRNDRLQYLLLLALQKLHLAPSKVN